MKQFHYVIKEKIGLHARPAGMFVKEAAKHAAAVTVEYLSKRANAKSVLEVMALGVRMGDEITVEVEGAQEEDAAAALEAFCRENL